MTLYDKADFHRDSVAAHGLPEGHAANHTVVFLRWLIDHNLMSEMFLEESGEVLPAYHAGNATIHEVYECWYGCLVDEMLSDEGDEFASHYFDFDNGAYLTDYSATLQGNLPSEFHIEYSEQNYRLLEPVIDAKYKDWKQKAS